MLKCREVAARASRLIDGELGPWQRLRMELHLAMCRGCRYFVEQMKRTRDLTRMTVSPEDQEMSAEIEAALAQRRSRSTGRS